MYTIGQIFENIYPADCANWCNDNNCHIQQIDNNGNILQVFDSATKAEKQLGWSYNSIKKVCDGKAKHTHNRYFRYSNPLKRKLLEERNK